MITGILVAFTVVSDNKIWFFLVYCYTDFMTLMKDIVQIYKPQKDFVLHYL